ncbi:MAG: hypothetical protein J0H91_19610 [Rhodospirillales bacterium]|nr:hypothetical protein [Rhodospirillales bacterium]
MGVNIYTLDSRPVRLSIAGVESRVGSLRRSWKITELDDVRAAELDASEASSYSNASPCAAIVADAEELPLGSSGFLVKAHLVIGWDEGRTRVTDLGWDYLPTLGYAVRNPDAPVFLLHECVEGTLRVLDRKQAVEIGLVGKGGQIIRRGQPTISACRSVRPYISGYAEADCSLSDGRDEKLLVAIADELPTPAWLVGKKPMDVERYVGTASLAGTGGSVPK